MNSDDYGPRKRPDIKMTPEDREAAEEFTIDEMRTKVILTPQEVRAMGGKFPFTRVGTREVNGEIIEEIQELYRIDALGRVVRNDDFAGYSWTGLIIPHDRYGECPDHFDRHGTRLVFIGIDGWQEYGTVLCTECRDIYEWQLKLEQWTLGLVFRAKPLKEARYAKPQF
jgi:hypothetical protein